MLLTLTDRLGDWNPQLFRELKGRLSGRKLLLATATSVVVQGLLISANSNSTCTKYVDSIVSRCVEYHWEIYWQPLFMAESIILMLLLFAGGVYMLVADIVREQNRGTLNFIRLSPRSSQSILLGKILGVPFLLYWGIALALPLQWVAAVAAEIDLGWVLSCDLLVAAAGSFFYLLFLLNALLLPAPYQAIAASFVGCWVTSLYTGFLVWGFDSFSRRYIGDSYWKWFSVNVGQDLMLKTIWTGITFGVASYWTWQALNRRFRNPSATLLSKGQSYWLTASFQIWLLGWLWSFYAKFMDLTELNKFAVMLPVSIVNLAFLLIIVGAITPHRQILVDWARYLEASLPTAKGQKMQDLVWGEKSPIGWAVTINLTITSAIWLPWLVAQVGVVSGGKVLAGMVLSANLIWMYALLVQLFTLGTNKFVTIRTGVALSAVIGLPSVLFSVLEVKNATLWMFAVFGSCWQFLPEASVTSIFFSLLGQIVTMIMLDWQLRQQLNELGASTSKELLADVKG
ncbi:MAG TPA: hypothetical protein IGS52_07010 [Oscillatoriaceae cyanobacterium M33_DOE_052]|uniref:Uncharacterized protein n=1 Tax=Planktothricoides sp. SpSt-374 TaxID=2282167 RepID=A0A7C3VLN9_9CYAN|nr:hypothetical protein [Oscillatoriaceae cyanobacterium M33_DOE_052]